MKKKDLYLSDVAEIIEAFYKDAETVGTTDAVINVISKAYNAGKAAGKAEA
jgi:hypothetical protein